MSIYVGTNKIKNIYIGTDKIKSIYVGTQKVYSSSGFPSFLQKCEWIGRSSSSYIQYIDTGISVPSSTWDIEFCYIPSGGAQVCGCTDSTANKRCMLTIGTSWYSTNARGSYFNVSYPSDSGMPSGTMIKHRFTAIKGQSGTTVTRLNDGATTTSSVVQGDFAIPNNFYIIAQNYKGSARTNGVLKVGYCKLNFGGVTYGEFIPCYTKTSGSCKNGNTGNIETFASDTIGMWDTISNAFFVNQGNGTFIKGNDV